MRLIPKKGTKASAKEKAPKQSEQDVDVDEEPKKAKKAKPKAADVPEAAPDEAAAAQETAQKPEKRTRTNGTSYRTQPVQEEPELNGATAGAYGVPIVPPHEKKHRVSANVRRRQEYLEAIAKHDKSVQKEVEIGGKKVSRKKGYKEWYNDQYAPGFDGEKFTIKNKKAAPRKVFQATIVKEAYKLVQNDPRLKGKEGNNLRLKVMSTAMKNFQDVYQDENFLTFVQDPQACKDMINDFAIELENQIAAKSK